VAKDVFVIWVFCWAIASNTFQVVASLEHLATRRQFIAARALLRLDWDHEHRIPLRCVPFPWHWGVIIIGVIAMFLIVWEWTYFATLQRGAPGAFAMMLLGAARELLFLVVIAEVMLFYKGALIQVRQSLK
jgi:hypothetical protein